jgi:hypothetical protein
MNIHRLAAVVAIAACSCAAACAQGRTAEPREVHGFQPFHAGSAGICTNKDDFSFSGASSIGLTGAFRIYCDLIGGSTHGSLKFQALAEEVFSTTACTLAGGVSGGYQYPLKGFTIVLTFNSKLDQLFLTLGSGSECGNPAITPVGIGKATLTVVGGTGRFDGASGTLSISWQDRILAVSALQNIGFFANFNCTVDGFITLQ